MLKTAVFRRLWDWKGPFCVDCCCSPDAVQRDMAGRELQYVSPFMRESLHRNVLTFCHPGKLYAFPPAPIIGSLIGHVLREKLKMIMVVPEWPTQLWYALTKGHESMCLGLIGEKAASGKAGLGHPFGRSFEREWHSVEM